MIIDAVMLFNELDILEIRLNELNSVVDYFVIVESADRHGSAAPKAPALKENWQRFKAFEHKIVYSCIKLEPAFSDTEACRWGRENFQRNALLDGIRAVSRSSTDLVILSDCDEIPRASAVTENADLREMKRLNMDFFYYNVNRYIGNWCRSTIGPLSAYQASGGLQCVRDITGRYSWSAIDNAGWHFSFFCDIAHLREKAESFAESGEHWGKILRERTDRQIALDVLNGVDIFHRSNHGNGGSFTYRETKDHRLPSHFLNNVERFSHFTEDGFRRACECIL
jgi:beta-1,4-mannosyl-glycoprotein beta-1,4-N-acetylglucosaminyltransferase